MGGSDGRPSIITPGPDGALWFTETEGNRIGRITTDSEVSPYSLPMPGAGPFGFTPWGSNQIGRIPSSDNVAVYAIQTPGAEPHGIALGPDSALWYTE